LVILRSRSTVNEKKRNDVVRGWNAKGFAKQGKTGKQLWTFQRRRGGRADGASRKGMVRGKRKYVSAF